MQKAAPGAYADQANGEPGELHTTVIDLSVSYVQVLQTMITSSQAQCSIGNLVVYNGLTTQQVSVRRWTSSLCNGALRSRCMFCWPTIPDRALLIGQRQHGDCQV